MGENSIVSVCWAWEGARGSNKCGLCLSTTETLLRLQQPNGLQYLDRQRQTGPVASVVSETRQQCKDL